MEFIFLIFGIILGILICFFYLKNKYSGFINKQFLENQQQENNLLNIKFKIIENDFNTLQKYNQIIEEKMVSIESENIELHKKATYLKTFNENQELKIQELNDLFNKENKIKENLYSENQSLKNKNIEVELKFKNAISQLDQQENNIINLDEEIKKISIQNRDYFSKIAHFQAVNQNLSENINIQKQEIENLHNNAKLEFEKIANKILEEKSEKFSNTNKLNIENILKPLGENIESFKKKVEETYEKESKQRFSLEDKIKELVNQTNRISSEANNLTSALKGQTKKQGNWGEIILETILENSELKKNINYFVQPTIKDKNGNYLRPDIILKLPENRSIIIDSKVSLISYERFCSAEDIPQQKIHLQAHLQSFYNHINDLSSKKYDYIVENSLDFIIMFIPIEPSYLIAIQADNYLWEYAYKKRILLVSPTNFIACLKLIDNLWKRDIQYKSVQDIVKRGELMYEKFVVFTKTLEDLGKSIDLSQKKYQESINQLNQGRGNLINQAIELKKLGLKSSKEIPEEFIPIKN